MSLECPPLLDPEFVCEHFSDVIFSKLNTCGFNSNQSFGSGTVSHPPL